MFKVVIQVDQEIQQHLSNAADPDDTIRKLNLYGIKGDRSYSYSGTFLPTNDGMVFHIKAVHHPINP